MIHLIAAALSTDTLGAPNTITISNSNSTANNGETAGIVFYNNGSFARYFSGVPNVTGTWLAPQSNFSEYEIRATVTGDSLTSGTEDTWEALSTTRSWTLENPTVATVLSSAVLIEIRWTGNDVVQDDATYDLIAGGPLS